MEASYGVCLQVVQEFQRNLINVSLGKLQESTTVRLYPHVCFIYVLTDLKCLNAEILSSGFLIAV